MASLSGIIWTSGSIQQFIYTPDMLTGELQGMYYLTLLGPLALQAFQYDYIRNLISATLLEDADGILPAGSGTCDVTPTVQWTAPTGSVGPFLYSWTLQTTDASGNPASTIASGTTVNVNAATMPTLVPGIYIFNVIATGNNGGTTTLQPLVFQVIDCKFEFPPKVTLISPFDIEPVVPTDEDYIRYLPQWMSVHGTATAPPSASKTFQFLQPVLKDLRKVEKATNDLEGEFVVNSVPLNLPRKAWHLQSRFTSRDVITINCVASGVITPIRRETSVFNFLNADDPVYIMGDNGHIAFRNLAQREVIVPPVSGSTGATGSVLQFLSTQYHMPSETVGMVPDANVLFFFNGLEYRIRAGSNGVDPAQSVVQLTAPFSGTITFRYQSKTLAPVVTVAISGNPAISPSPTDLWNRFDELGLSCGLVRRRDEDNIAFQKRVYARFISSPGTDTKSVAEHIAQDLTLVDIKPWDGITTIDLSGQDIWGVKYFGAEGLPQTSFANEQLVPYGSNYTIYSGSKSNWLPGWSVFVNGRTATLSNYPNMIVSGNTVNFGTPVTGNITASYSYNNYLLTRTGANTILTVVPDGSNPLSGSYIAIFTKNVQLHTPADLTYIRTSLLNANGTPNALFYEIATRLLEGSPIHFGRARWGPSAHWLEPTDQQPLTSHLPTVFDVISGY